MALREKKSTKQRHIEFVEREQKKKIFIVAEGDKTEIKYFQGLKENLIKFIKVHIKLPFIP